jgi:uncharacterized delta-60 repeat protein
MPHVPAASVQLSFVLLVFSFQQARSASSSWLDTRFDPGSGFDEAVQALAVQPDGKLLVGGAFTQFDGVPRHGIVRLLENGALDPSFGPNTGVGVPDTWRNYKASVFAVGVQADGQILIGGEFTQVNGVPRLRLARLQSDGALDPSFQPAIENQPGEDPANPNDSYGFPVVYVVHIQPDGKIFVGGAFNSVNGVSGIRFARLNSDGSLDATYNTVGSLGFDDVVQGCMVLGDGRVVLAGFFDNLFFPDYRPSFWHPALRQLTSDGHREAAFEHAMPAGLTVSALSLLPDGDIFSAGPFDPNPYDYSPARGLVMRTHPDGSIVWTNFLATRSTVDAALPASNGGMFIGGDFEAAMNKHREHVAQLLPDGSLDQCFAFGLRLQGHFGSNPTRVQAMQLSADGTGLFIGGSFMEIDGVARAGIARLQVQQPCDGGQIQFATPETRVRQDAGAGQVTLVRTRSDNQPASVVFESQDGSAQAGLDYTPVSETVTFAPGELAKTVEIPVRFYPRDPGDKAVHLILRDAAGGAALDEPQEAALQISQATGLETVLVPDPGYLMSFSVADEPWFIPTRDGKWLMSTCTRQDSPLAFVPSITRLNADWTLDNTFTFGLVANACPGPVVFQDDGKMVMAGSFDTSDGLYSAWMARVRSDGSPDATFQPPIFQPLPSAYAPTATNQYISFGTMQVLSSNELLVSGHFSVRDGTVEHRGLVKLLPDGSLDSSFHLDVPDVYTANLEFVEPDGKLLVTVDRWTASSDQASFIRLEPDGQLDPAFQVADLQSPWPHGFQPDGKVVVSGAPLARLNPDGSADASYRLPNFEASQAGGPYVSGQTPLPNSDSFVTGNFDSIDGIQYGGFARILSDGALDAGFRVDLPVLVTNGIPYQPFIEVLQAAEDTLLALVLYTATVVADPAQFWRLQRFHFMTTNTPPRFQLDAAAPVAVMESAGEAVVIVSRLGAALDAVSVHFATAPETAHEWEDYLPQAGTLQFAPGERRKEIHIPIIDDKIVEPDETFRVLLGDPSPGAAIAGTNSVQVQILNDDAGFAFSPVEYQVGELDRVVILQIQRTGTFTNPISVDCYTQDGTATGGQDYVSHRETLNFDYAAQTTASIAITIRDDALVEGNETFQVVLSNPTGGATLGPDSVATVTIIDNDLPGQPGRGVDGDVYALAAPSDGTVMVGGTFSTINGAARTSLARLQPDFLVDPAFDAHLDSGTRIDRIAVQPDGGVVVIGTFTNIQGVARTGIARFLPDGTLDRTFAPEFHGLDSLFGYLSVGLTSVLALPDGKVLVGGAFTNVNGVVRVGIVRLNADGTVDPRFGHGSFFGSPPPGRYVTDIAMEPNGQILIAGRGNGIGDDYHNTVLRLDPDGGLDLTFSANLWLDYVWGGQVPYLVRALFLQIDGQVLVLHASTDDYGTGPPLVRLQSNGTQDLAFSSHIPSGNPFSNPTWTGGNAVLQSGDGSIWVGGERLFRRLSPDGSLDLTNQNPFSDGLDSSLVLFDDGHNRYTQQETPAINAFALKPDGRIVVGGNFRTCGGLPAYGLAEVSPDGTVDGLLRLDAPHLLDNGNLQMSLTLPTGVSVTLERSADLQQWTPLWTATAITNHVQTLDPDAAVAPARFYRLHRR